MDGRSMDRIKFANINNINIIFYFILLGPLDS